MQSPKTQNFPTRPLLLIGVVLLLVGGVVALMVVDIPAPQTMVEKEIKLGSVE